MENKRNYYVVIPSKIYDDENLSANEKLFYGLITSLTNEKGYCWATNKYLAERSKATERAVQTWLSNLSKQKYLTIQVERNEKNQVTARYIWLTEALVLNELSKKKEKTNQKKRKAKNHEQEAMERLSQPIEKQAMSDEDLKEIQALIDGLNK